MRSIDQNIIRQIFVLLLILLIGGLIFWEMVPYLSGVLGAITIYVLFRNWMAKLITKGWNPNLAASLIMFISFVLILVPVGGLVLMLGNKVSSAVDKSESVIEAIKNQMYNLEKTLDYDLTSQMDFSGASSWLSNSLQGLAGGTFNIFISIAIMYFLLFYMLTNRKELRDSLFEYLPISKKNIKLIGDEVQSMVRSNALGIPMVAVAQGIVALIGFFIFGVPNPFFWFVIVAVGSMIPFIGTLIGIIPVFILAMSNGNEFQAWGILIYGFVVVGSTDNLIRLYVLRKLDNVHPLITLIGVIIGVPLFGFIGLIFGPLLISLFLIVVRIYKKEYGGKGNVGAEQL
ncbi:Predicted PurR-regulated permease PerM [Pricia antarctica]|uniref:Predicted PurR-regulated permease PerM n=1 Tax=Pricia antarctica TaxID=641691 RepID=A0A1G7FQW5_9FLAO|nr:AI-2E family transporter [Pricia antarctica]SDE78232.1 Predicted PurR-regulated permease PerM [Pricia antarctica]